MMTGKKWQMGTGQAVILSFLGIGFLVNSGCITATVGAVATMIIADRIDDADVKERAAKLQGKPTSAADEMFGERRFTFVNMDKPDHEAIIYSDPKKPDGDIRFVVEAIGNKITAVSKEKMGAHKGAAKKLSEKLEGKSSAECREIAKVSEPMLRLREIGEGTLLEIFETKGKFGDERYLLLYLDGSGNCIKADLIDKGKTTRDDV